MIVEVSAMLRSKNAPDRSKIAVDRPEELKYWSKHFGVTAEELHRLIAKVGNSATAVRKELQLGKVEGRTPGRHVKEPKNA